MPKINEHCEIYDIYRMWEFLVVERLYCDMLALERYEITSFQ